MENKFDSYLMLASVESIQFTEKTTDNTYRDQLHRALHKGEIYR